MRGVSDDALHQLVSQMRPLFFEKGHVIAKEMTSADSIYIVANGCLELYTEFEGNEFVIERLYKGTIINQRSFLMEDIIYVNIRAIQNSRLLQLNSEMIEEMRSNFSDFDKAISME